MLLCIVLHIVWSYNPNLAKLYRMCLHKVSFFATYLELFPYRVNNVISLIQPPKEIPQP